MKDNNKQESVDVRVTDAVERIDQIKRVADQCNVSWQVAAWALGYDDFPVNFV